MIQVFTYIVLTLPAVGEALYLTVTLDENGSIESDLKYAVDRFFFAFTGVLSYLSISLPFYLYTLTGRTFRQAIVKIITKMKCCPF
jgi:ABC-type molybdate transport system permease subunit